MEYENADIHKRTMMKVDPKSRRRCNCGCKNRATHIGLANNIGLTQGCELYIRRWVKNI